MKEDFGIYAQEYNSEVAYWIIEKALSVRSAKSVAVQSLYGLSDFYTQTFVVHKYSTMETWYKRAFTRDWVFVTPLVADMLFDVLSGLYSIRGDSRSLSAMDIF